MTASNKRFLILLGVASALLLVPAIAMNFSREVHWTGFDFIVAACLLFTALLAIEGVFRFIPTKQGKLFTIASIAVLLFLTWAELAVGIFGTPFAGS